jgi:hypothetical protein
VIWAWLIDWILPPRSVSGAWPARTVFDNVLYNAVYTSAVPHNTIYLLPPPFKIDPEAQRRIDPEVRFGWESRHR